MLSLLLFLVTFLVIWCMFGKWIIHISMNLECKKPYDFVSFDTFIKEFNKYENDKDLDVEEWSSGKSIFLYKWEDTNRVNVLYLHADIVEINGKCMIFYPLDYFKYIKWKKNFRRKPYKDNRVKGLWLEESK